MKNIYIYVKKFFLYIFATSDWDRLRRSFVIDIIVWKRI